MILQLCESCGREADVRLPDGSIWCASCDIAARDLGYDNDPCEWIAKP